jgi:hypothetical protein
MILYCARHGHHDDDLHNGARKTSVSLFDHGPSATGSSIARSEISNARSETHI